MNSFLPWPLEWTHARLALIGAPVAALVVVVVVRIALGRALRRGGNASPGLRAAVWSSALARGAAVLLALLAAAGPFEVRRETPAGESLVAAPSGAAVTDATRVLRYPGDAADALDALAIVRASHDPSRGASLSLVTDGGIGNGVGDTPGPALRRALAPFPGFETGIVAIPATPDGDATTPLPSPTLVVPTAPAAGVPFSLSLVAGRSPFAAARGTLSLTPTASSASGATSPDGVSSSIEFDVAAGATRVVLPAVTLAAGTHRIDVALAGRRPAASFVHVAAPPRVLLLTRSAREGLGLSALLEAQGIDLLVTGSLSGLSEALDQADVFVVAPGVGGAGVMSAVARRVRGGAGLLVLGGPGEDGLSRLHGSELAALLPVVVPRPTPKPPRPPAPKPPPSDRPRDEPPSQPEAALDEGEKQALRVALLLCIDRSGSMAGAKMRLAQEAALAAARTLAPEDRVGVIAFDDRSDWIAPFQGAERQGTLIARVRAMEADGGTNFYPALKEGYARILEQNCGIRHIVLLTDGVTRTAVFSDMVLDGARAGVTLSTVAVGDGADTRLLGLLAGWGRGRLYLADDPERLPAVVTLDSQTFGAEVREERRKELTKPDVQIPVPPRPPEPETQATPADTDATAGGTLPPDAPGVVARAPVVAAPAPALAGLLTAAWPRVASPEEVDLRTGAFAPLVWDSGRPALALGRGVLGRVAVIAGDVTTADATEFFAWEESGRFLAQLVRSLQAPPRASERPVQARFLAPRGAGAYVQIESASAGALMLTPVGGGPRLDARLENSGTGGLASLGAVPPAGVYAGFLEQDDGTLRRVVAVSPGPRVDPLRFDPAELSRAAGAALLSAPPPPPPSPRRERRVPVETPFIAGALALLLFESLFRRGAR